jgi:hypothetical protein
MERLSERILAADVATVPVASLPGSMPLSEAWAQCRTEALDFSVVLVDSGADGTRRLARRDSSWKLSEAPLETVSTELGTALVVNAAAPLSAAISLVRDHGVAFCSTSDELGIVTPADLTKRPCALWMLGRILDFESALTLLFPSVTNRMWEAELSEAARQRLQSEVNGRKSDGTYTTREDCLSLSQKLRISKRWLRETLGSHEAPMSKSSYRKAFGWISTARNDLAHGRPPVGHDGGMRELLTRLDRLDQISDELWDRVMDREDVWDRYSESEVFVLDGDEATPVWQVRDDLPEVCWMVSAMNPFERVLSEQINKSRHDALRDETKRRGIFVCEGIGRAPEVDGWRERMVLIARCNRETAVELSRWYGQRSVFELSDRDLVVVEVQTGDVRRSVPLQ